MRRYALFFLLLLPASCYTISDKEFNARMDRDGDGIPGTEDCDDQNADIGATGYQDLDGDGFGTIPVDLDGCDLTDEAVAWQGGDCGDENAEVNPKAEEICNDVDDDCDGDTDEECTEPDLDGDGYDAAVDCDDENAAISPGADEYCNDVDDDCDGDTDEDDAVGAATWYEDLDQDAYGNSETGVTSCDRPTGYADNGDDCDDTDVTASPGSPETCDGVDDDCDGEIDEDFDLDEDGYLDREGCGDGPDCDDSDASVHPGADDPEGDGVDQDCDGDDG